MTWDLRPYRSGKAGRSCWRPALGRPSSSGRQQLCPGLRFGYALAGVPSGRKPWPARLFADEEAPAAAVASLQAAVGRPDIRVFVAVPSIEYWVVGDEAAADAIRRQQKRKPSLESTVDALA